MSKFAKKKAFALIAKSRRAGKRHGDVVRRNVSDPRAFQDTLSTVIADASNIHSWRNNQHELRQIIKFGEYRLQAVGDVTRKLRAAAEKSSNNLDTRSHIIHLRKLISKGEELGLNNRAGALLDARSFLVTLQTAESLKKALNKAVSRAQRTRHKGLPALQETLGMYVNAIGYTEETATLQTLKEARNLITELEKEFELTESTKACQDLIARVHAHDESTGAENKVALVSARAELRSKMLTLAASLESVVDAQAAARAATSLISIIDTVVHLRACVLHTTKSWVDGGHDVARPDIQNHMQILDGELHAATTAGVQPEANVMRDARSLLAEWHNAKLCNRVTAAHNLARVSRNPDGLTEAITAAIDDGADHAWPDVKAAQELLSVLTREKQLERTLRQRLTEIHRQRMVLDINATTTGPALTSLIASLRDAVELSVRSALRAESPVLEAARDLVSELTTMLNGAVARAKKQVTHGLNPPFNLYYEYPLAMKSTVFTRSISPPFDSCPWPCRVPSGRCRSSRCLHISKIWCTMGSSRRRARRRRPRVHCWPNWPR